MRRAVRLSVKVAPRSAHNAIAEWVDDTLKLRVTAAPEKGKANKAALALLAETLGIAKERIRLIRGAGSMHKQVEIDGMNLAEIRRRLANLKANG